MAAGPDIAEQRRLERTMARIRWGAVVLVFVLGPLFPNLSQTAVVVLGLAVVAYNVAVLWLTGKAATAEDQRRIAALAFGADLVALSASMLLFSVDPYWTTFVVGPLVIIGGAFRFGSSGAYVSAVVLGSAYAAISVFRQQAFGLPFQPERVAFHLSVFALAAVLVDRIVRDVRLVRDEREELIRRLERTVAEGAAITAALRLIAGGPGKSVAPAVLEASRGVFRFDRATVFVADRTIGEYVVVHRLTPGGDTPTPRMRLGEGLVGAAFAAGHSLLVHDVLEDPRYVRRPESEEHRSVIIVPLSVGGEPIAALSLSRALPDGFGSDDVRLAETVGALVAQVLENEKLFAEASEARALRELDRLKDDFLAAVSHELRTPLTVISGSLELLAREGDRLSGQAARLIERAETHTRRLDRNVQDLLDLAQLQEARIELQKEFVGARSVLSDAAAAHEPVAAARHQRVVVECADDVPPILVDKRRMQQIVGNLLQNATRYSPEGTIVRARAERAGDSIRISVSDQGPGVPATERARIFDKFYRGERTKTTTSGSGLGLAIARTLVELHGGRIHVEDAEGGGARFVVEIPYEPVPAVAEA
jgi:signal transduction histidine kinase